MFEANIMHLIELFHRFFVLCGRLTGQSYVRELKFGFVLLFFHISLFLLKLFLLNHLFFVHGEVDVGRAYVAVEEALVVDRF